MEVEIKLRLPDSLSHRRVSSLLFRFRVKTHRQENIFFDGANGELSSKFAILRLRFYDNDSLCVVSLKAKPVICDGVSRVEEDEEELDPMLGRACEKEPSKLGSVDSRLVRRAKEEFGIGEGEFVCLNCFRNVREVFEWEGLKVELDETKYTFGTCYEVECETDQPDEAKKALEGFLKENRIPYSYSKQSKFGVFRSGKLSE